MSMNVDDRAFGVAGGYRAFVQPVLLLVLGVVGGVATLFAPSETMRFAVLAGATGCFIAAVFVGARNVIRMRQARQRLLAAMDLVEHDPAACYCTDPKGAKIGKHAQEASSAGHRVSG